MDIEIAIPSYNRPHILKKKTLELLKYIDNSIITIYLEDSLQLSHYKSVLDDKYRFVITNTKGIGDKRNYIKEHTKAKYLFQIDDDIHSIIDQNNNIIDPLNIFDLIKKGFKLCEENGLRLWGICGYSNSYFLKDNISTNLKFIIGNFHGTIMTGQTVYTPIDTMEDYYNTLKYFEKDGGVLRLNMYGTKTNFHKENGGLQSVYTKEQRNEQETKNALFLKSIFKDMVSVIEKKDRLDLRLNPYYKSKDI